MTLTLDARDLAEKHGNFIKLAREYLQNGTLGPGEVFSVIGILVAEFAGTNGKAWTEVGSIFHQIENMIKDVPIQRLIDKDLEAKAKRLERMI